MTRHATLLALVVVTAWVTLCTQQDHMSVNPASRYAVMEALVEHDAFAIDGTSLLRNTVDKVRWEGRMFSSKPILLPTMLAPAYAAVRAVTGEGFREAKYPTARRMRVLVGVAPWLVAMLLWLVLVRKLTADPEERAFAGIAMIVGGLPTAYASHLDNHSFAFLALLAMALAGHRLVSDDEASVGELALAGLCGGAAVTFDLGATPIVGAFLAWAAWRSRQRPGAVAALAAAAAVPLLCQTAIQWATTGQPRPFYLLREAYDYPGSYWRNPVEFDALGEPRAVYAFHALFGHHGMFSVTPWLLLGVPWLCRRESTRAAEQLRWVAIVAGGFVVAYYVLRTVNYGGRCVGMRWFMVVHPILAFGAVRTVSRYRLVQRWPVLLGVLVALSAVSAVTGALNPWEEGFVYALFRGVGLGSVPG